MLYVRMLIILLACLAFKLELIASQSHYSIIAPNTIRPNSQFHVVVSVHKSEQLARVKLGLLSSTYSDFKVVEVRPYSSEVVQFEVPALKRDRYSLTAEGITGIVFTNETLLNFEAKQLSVLVHTDRAIYKPGDIVRYRILVLDANLKPVHVTGPVNVKIKDAGKNTIKSFKDARLMNSVFSGELQLSELPKLGEWSINVDVEAERKVQTFEVVEYILPKFIVVIDTAKHVIYKNGKIMAAIRANYAYGKAIKGEATLSIYPTFFGSLQPFVNDLITRKVTSIDGETFFEFDIQNELKLKKDYEREYLLDALVEETSTGSVQNFSTVITVHLDAYRVETLKLPSYYIPGVSFDVTVKVIRTDGAELTDGFEPQLTAYLTNVYGSSEMYNKTVYTLNSSGVVKMEFTVSAEDKDEYHSCIVNYLGIITDVGKIPRKQLHSDNFITANVLNARPNINQEILVNIRSNRPLKYFVYQIVGRGDILLSNSVEVADSSFATFKFLGTFVMAPRATLLVYVVMDGEFLYDEQIIEFEENFVNEIQIEAPLRAIPGQDIDISISTKPYSFVGLMAVDQNTLRIRRGNNLSYDNIKRVLTEYELRDANTPIASPGELSGVIVMSNAEFITEKEPAGRTPMPDDGDKLTTIRKTDIGPAHKIEVNTRAPGKGPYAFSYTPKPFWHNPRIHVMVDPVDTLLFKNVSSGNDGRKTIQTLLPNTMTTWEISAFSLDPVTGLGLSNPTRIIQSYKDFYITSTLPYSIRRGEIIALQFVVFNNKENDLDVDVTLYNTAQDFDFPSLEKKSNASRKIELYSRRTIRVLAKSAKPISFIVTPKKVGSINVKAVASTQLAGDTVEGTLLVEYPGATETIQHGLLLDLSESPQIKQNFTIRVPPNAIEYSTRIEVSVVGDVMGSVLPHIDNLILLPSGCGEQSMVEFMPNLLVLKYLQRIGQLTVEMEMRTKRNLELAYQSLLYYRHTNGAFSAFGLSEKNSSTWLTAYVARAFRQAAIYTQIDENVIRTALSYVIGMQTAEGSFTENGDVFENYDDKDLVLTSFVALALLENINFYPEYRNNMNKAMDFIARRLDGTSDIYALAMGTYVLSLTNHESKGAFIQTLDSMAINKGGKKWWVKAPAPVEGQSPWYNRSRSTNIEISSYAALALLQNNLIADALPVLKWLVDQRNEFGGFVASQDTVVGLQALMAFAERFSSQANNMQVSFHYGQSSETFVNVNEQNSLVLQNYELPGSIKNVTITAVGRGMALAQIIYKFNTNVTSAWPRFVLDPTVNRNSHSNYLHLSACTSFVSTDTIRSNMAVMEVYLPSGFVVDTDTLPTLESSERIKKVETQRRNTVVIIYFDYLDRRQVCPTLHAYRTTKVTKHQPVPVIMYDYYDNTRRARMFYRAPKSSICDICEDAHCGSSCEKAEKRESRRYDEVNTLEGSILSSSCLQQLQLIPIVMILPILITFN